MAQRHTTPPNPALFDLGINVDFQSPSGSASSRFTFGSQDWSPETVLTTATSPPRSPFRVREIGSRLLPKPRDQDQILGSSPAVSGHSRAVSLPNNMLQAHFGMLPCGPGFDRRSHSPPVQIQISPASTPLSYDIHQSEATIPVRPGMPTGRSVSTSSVRTHSRNTSTSSVDVISRFGYPYRSSPAPPSASMGMPMSRTPSAMSHLTPMAMPDGSVQGYPNRRRTASPPARPSALATEIVPIEYDEPTTTMLEYLTSPNPAPSLTSRVQETNQNMYYWFDVRNIRVWDEFRVESIPNMPDGQKLLDTPVPQSSLPKPGLVNLSPEVPAQLAEMCANHHGVKVNAALKLWQGQRHMAIRLYKPAPGGRSRPEFVASYQSDVEQTIYGEGRGRVVGIVKCYDQWNSGMYHGDAMKRIQYLQHLSHLHHSMREHGTRYGFIITEIEVVCVRMGGPARPDNVPLFGFLEVAPAVQISAHGLGANGSLQMTAGLALWYLHMLAKEQPLPGQYHWKLDVGLPAAMTRRNHLPRDEGMPKEQQMEKRRAKRSRKWVWPHDPPTQFETGRRKLTGTKPPPPPSSEAERRRREMNNATTTTTTNTTTTINTTTNNSSAGQAWLRV